MSHQPKSPRHQRSCCPLTQQPALQQIHAAQTAGIKPNFPSGIAQPALRALFGAGLESLEQLTGVSESELLKLHGMGPAAVKKLRESLQDRGLKFQPDTGSATRSQ